MRAADAPSLSVHDDCELQLRIALANLAQRTRFPIVFGGFAGKDQLVVTQLMGNRRDTLRGLAVRTGWGLGGRVLQERRPRLTSDYGASRIITHDYDAPVLAEGITSLLAIPVIVGSSVRAVLYGGVRTSLSVGDVSIEPAVRVAQELAASLSSPKRPSSGVEDLDTVVAVESGSGAARLEELRMLFADVRAIMNRLTDPDIRARLAAVQDGIATLAGGETASRVADADPPHSLTPREIDVLSLVAVGCPNAAIGRTLGVTESTVKSYMNAAMRKLDARTRYEAVARARRQRLLP